MSSIFKVSELPFTLMEGHKFTSKSKFQSQPVRYVVARIVNREVNCCDQITLVRVEGQEVVDVITVEPEWFLHRTIHFVHDETKLPHRVYIYQSMPYYNHEAFVSKGYQDTVEGLAFYTEYFRYKESIGAEPGEYEVITFDRRHGKVIDSDGSLFFEAGRCCDVLQGEFKNHTFVMVGKDGDKYVCVPYGEYLSPERKSYSFKKEDFIGEPIPV